jgi:LysR family transcriptional regulator, transcription activator of glutamate synthase operon
MEFRQLQYFVTVADLGKMTLAAKRLFVSQPALSLQIAALERELGVSLFARKNRQLVLTRAGELLLAEVRPALTQLAQARILMEEIGKGMTGFLRVAAAVVPMRYLVMPAAAELRSQLPQFSIQLVEEGYGSVMSLLERGDVDLAVGNFLPSLNTVHSESLCTVYMYGLLSPGHRLAGRTYLTVEELAHEDLILQKAGQATRFMHESLLHLYGLHASSVFESHDHETLLAAAERGLGVAVTSDLVPYDGYELTSIPVVHRDKQVELQTVLAWDSRRDLPEGAARFIGLVKEISNRRQISGYQPWQSEMQAVGDATEVEPNPAQVA